MSNLAACEETGICIMHQVTGTVLFLRSWWIYVCKIILMNYFCFSWNGMGLGPCSCWTESHFLISVPTLFILYVCCEILSKYLLCKYFPSLWIYLCCPVSTPACNWAPQIHLLNPPDGMGERIKREK